MRANRGGRLPNSKNQMGKVLMELREEFKTANKIMPIIAEVENAEDDSQEITPTVTVVKINKIERQQIRKNPFFRYPKPIDEKNSLSNCDFGNGK